jgi:5-methylcytosine-specific restriction endonuclease McrA
MKDWKPIVYHLPEDFNNEPEWKAIEKVVKQRDGFRCRSCRKKQRLSVHHILPRSEGGKDYPPNLITLCQECHNEIENLGLKTAQQIDDLNYHRKYIKKDKTQTETSKAIKWQQWVYGGYKRPCLDI